MGHQTTHKYEDPVIRAYHDLLESNMQGVFRRFYYGDPIRVPSSLLPACIISHRETRVSHHTNTQDEHEMQFQMTVITDIRQDIDSENGSDGMVAGINRLYELIEGRDTDTLQLRSNSVLGVLRGTVLVDAANELRTDLDTITRADYGLVIGKRDAEAWSVEAEIEFIAKFYQTR